MKASEALKQVDAGIDALVEALAKGRSESLTRFLTFQSKFADYSFRNCLLIAVQRPEATYVAGFRRWLELRRYVRKGEKGIMILAPLVRRRKAAADEVNVNDETSKKTVYGFRAVHVFDVSQTEGEDLPEFSRVTGHPDEWLGQLKGLVTARNIALRYEQTLGGAEGVSEGGKIALRIGMPPAEEFSVLVHELAHELLHRSERRKETTKKTRELEAEAVAFVVSNYVGLEGVEHSSDYIQLYNGDKDLLMQSLDQIQRVSADIIASLSEMTSACPGANRPALEVVN